MPRYARLTEADHQQIFDLAERGLKCGQISQRIGRNAGTVRWFMYRNGLAQPAQRHSMPIDRADSRGRKGYGPAEDALLLQMRTAGATFRDIAEQATARFGHRRTPHGVEVRLVMLAARDDQSSEAA